jgi:LysM repeat protein
VSARQAATPKPGRLGTIISGIAWLLALILVGVAGYLAWSMRLNPASARQAQASVKEVLVPTLPPAPVEAALPNFDQASLVEAIFRRPVLHTIIPDRPQEDIRDYTVTRGDSVFGIATKFNIKPDTVLWANYDMLNDNPDMISLGMQLKIPPTNGVLYKWQEGDTLDAVASEFDAKKEDILSFSGNHLDLTNPEIQPGTLVMIPGGHREFRQWIIPTIPRGKAGVSVGLYGAGACAGGYSGANGSGTFVWPAGNHYLSGNDYWGGHLGIDIAAGEGAPVFAADSGVVVFSGWANGGYGYMIMIDHGNGYQTLYGHLSSVNAGCGASVGQGGIIGYAGSTGNSTGPHLHFEVRYQGGFVNPWYVLPAP